MKKIDLIVIGGGVIGLATAYRYLQNHPDRSVQILEKESEVAVHQTGHNSGVLHSGIYYKPGSLKAENCRLGRKEMLKFCEQEEIEFEVCGKVIDAVQQNEIARLTHLYERGQANGIPCTRINSEQLQEIEPYAVGLQALHVPAAGIINYRQVCKRLARRIKEQGSQIHLNARVTAITPGPQHLLIQTSHQKTYRAPQIVNCAGLHCDRIATLTQAPLAAKIIPFRGEYYQLKPEAQHLVKHLIYPVPDPEFPFLGVHFTRMIDGTVECGPNAVFAFAREGYTRGTINCGDLFESLTYPGFLRMARKHWLAGAGEMWRSFSKQAFVKALQRLLPEIQSHHLVPAPAGVRAQAVTPDGNMVDDFLLSKTGNILNVGNAPSPAATASLAIGQAIVHQIDSQHKPSA